ncbi:MAG: hypothetical protein OEU94_14730, partial [Aquincola sp.]|nr:hypothetical protein [Aquincola sp.]
WDRDVVLDLYDANRRIFSHGRSERYTRIEIVSISRGGECTRRRKQPSLLGGRSLNVDRKCTTA